MNISLKNKLEFWGMQKYNHDILNTAIVSIGIGAQVEKRIWTTQGFVDIINYITTTYKYNVAIVGTELDCKKAKDIISNTKHVSRVFDFTGKTTIGEVGYIISKSKLLIANDSGLVHIGAACNIPVIAIFGPGYYKQWGPYSENSIVVRDDNCNPCGSNPNCNNIKCLTELSSNRIINVINLKLGELT